MHDNIVEFGGDPSRVLVFGESGGGAKNACLMGMRDSLKFDVRPENVLFCAGDQGATGNFTLDQAGKTTLMSLPPRALHNHVEEIMREG